MVLLHIVIALSSLVYTTYLFVRPSKRKFYVNYGLIALTLVSGTYLVVSTHAQMLQACTTGVIYIGAVTLGMIAARHRLAAASIRITKR